MATALQPAITISSPTLISKKRPAAINAGGVLLSASLLICILQLYWFGSKSIHQIDADGIDYVGIATELKEGLFHASINAFRSPLISWLIAVIPGLTPFQSGKLITILAYLSSVVLLYAFTRKLWHSSIAAGLSALLFAVARGVGFDAVALISPDFLLTALTIGYFSLLIDCIRQDRRWFWLGFVHGLAFLAKAIALPWLMVVTVVAIVVSVEKKRWPRRLACAGAIPLVAAILWASVLHSKYGVFTTGTQFKTNLFQWTLREYRNHRPHTYAVLQDISSNTDFQMVVDPMPPGSWGWTYNIQLTQVFRKIIDAERANLPLMMKGLVILANPGVVMGLVSLAWISLRRRTPVFLTKDARVMILIVLTAAITLVLAYCMLVVDERYLLPLFPLVIAVGSRFLTGSLNLKIQPLRTACWAMAAGSLVWSVIYPSSPFRVQKRDFQVICYEAGAALRDIPGTEIVSIGAGPFPEHGVGWEAAYKSAFFGKKRLIATDDTWPSEEPLLLNTDLQTTHASAILVWGSDNESRNRLVQNLRPRYSERTRIIDPILGDVGLVLFPSTMTASLDH